MIPWYKNKDLYNKRLIECVADYVHSFGDIGNNNIFQIKTECVLVDKDTTIEKQNEELIKRLKSFYGRSTTLEDGCSQCDKCYLLIYEYENGCDYCEFTCKLCGDREIKTNEKQKICKECDYM